MSYDVSVIVPTCKRPDLLKRCLDALLAQEYLPSAYEIIVVDDAACAMTRQAVEAMARDVKAGGYTLRYLPVTGAHGPAAARNAGWRAARSKIIAFTDDDCIPTSAWLQAGMTAFKPGVVGVSGKLLMPLREDKDGRSAYPTDYERNAAQLATSEFVTANCFYRRSVLKRVGGFDERFTMAWREDSDLIFSLSEEMRKHEKLAFAPGAVVVHPIRPAPWGISLRQQRKSMFNALLYKKHPGLYRKNIQAMPPWRYYVSVGAQLAALVCVLSGKRRMAVLAACLWGCMTAHFCRQRLQGTSRAPRHIAEMVVTSIVIPPLSIFWRIRGALKFRAIFL